MTDKQPEALRLANVCSNLTRYSMDAHLIAAYLRSQHAELETLRAGYAAARLEIALRKEHADELAVAYKQAVGSKNCMQCCVSYMLGLPLESVPDFATDGGWELFSEFVESKGYAAVMLPGNQFEADYLASGTTERGTSHMVVMNDGKLVHDPHPSNAGIVEVQCVWLLAKRATPRAVHADEQAAFEAVAKADTSNVSFIRDDTGYVDMTAAMLWHGWKLRASHGQAPVQPVAEPAQPAVPNSFIVSVVVIKEIGKGFNTQNKLYSIEAISPQEAEGKVLPLLTQDFPEYRLHTICHIATQPSPQLSPTAQAAESVPVLPDFDTVEQHIYGACRRYITQDMLAPIHNLIRDAIDADRAARAAQEGKSHDN